VFDGIVDSSLGLVFLCAVGAAIAVSPGYMSPYMNRLAMPAPMPSRFPLRSFARAALIVFIVMINAAGVFLTHRMPVGSTLVAVGFLMLLFLPADRAEDESRN
jgi:hypothetical protein